MKTLLKMALFPVLVVGGALATAAFGLVFLLLQWMGSAGSDTYPRCRYRELGEEID